MSLCRGMPWLGQEENVSSRNWSKGPLLDARDPKCECGSLLVMSSDGNGMLFEKCLSGCFSRPVTTRRPSCPECGAGPWNEKTGCESCGHATRPQRPPVTDPFWKAVGQAQAAEAKTGP